LDQGGARGHVAVGHRAGGHDGAFADLDAAGDDGEAADNDISRAAQIQFTAQGDEVGLRRGTAR